jgi:uncharacterized protein GlcG (DUF336 family)
VIMEALGRVINAHYPADDVYVSLVDAEGVTFLGHEVDGATVFTLTFATDAAGTATSTPAVIDHYYGKSADVSAGVWHTTTPSAANTVSAADGTEDYVAIEVLATMCPVVSGVRYPYVKCAADGAGTVTAILHDLSYPRAPQNLRSVTA